MNISLQQYCIALKQRNQYVTRMSGINSASPVKNREELNCTTPSTFAQLQMRRKAEVLQYKNNSSTTTTTQKQRYVRLAKSSTQTITSISSRICPDNVYLCAPSTSSDVPGPTITLCYDPSVNLIQPITTPANKRKSQMPRDPLDRPYNAFPYTNIVLNNSQSIADFVMVTPLASYMNFSFIIPLAVSISLNVDSISSSDPTIIFTPQLQFTVYYGDNLVYSTIVTPTQPITANINSVDNISATSYANTVAINNITLPTLTQDVYTVSMSQSNFSNSQYTASGCTITVPVVSDGVQWMANPGMINSTSTNCTITNVNTNVESFFYTITPLLSNAPC